MNNRNQKINLRNRIILYAKQNMRLKKIEDELQKLKDAISKVIEEVVDEETDSKKDKL